MADLTTPQANTHNTVDADSTASTDKMSYASKRCRWPLYDCSGAANPNDAEKLADLWRRQRLARGKPITPTLAVKQKDLDVSWTAFVTRWNEDSDAEEGVKSRERHRRGHGVDELAEALCQLSWDADRRCCYAHYYRGCNSCRGYLVPRPDHAGWRRIAEEVPLSEHENKIVAKFRRAVDECRRTRHGRAAEGQRRDEQARRVSLSPARLSARSQRTRSRSRSLEQRDAWSRARSRPRSRSRSRGCLTLTHARALTRRTPSPSRVRLQGAPREAPTCRSWEGNQANERDTVSYREARFEPTQHGGYAFEQAHRDARRGDRRYDPQSSERFPHCRQEVAGRHARIAPAVGTTISEYQRSVPQPSQPTAPPPWGNELQWVRDDAARALDYVDEEARRVDRHEELLEAMNKRMMSLEQANQALRSDNNAYKAGRVPPSSQTKPRHKGPRYAPAVQAPSLEPPPASSA